MMTRFVRSFVALAIMTFGIVGMDAIPAEPAMAAKCQTRFLTFPAWYEGVINQSTCEIKKPQGNDRSGGIGNFVWRIALNIIEIGLQLVAWASAGFIIYGGFKYLTSSGQPDKTVAARKTIMNAAIGLIISFFSVVIVTLVAGRIE